MTKNFKSMAINGFVLASLLIAFFIGQTNRGVKEIFSASKAFENLEIDSIVVTGGIVKTFSEGKFIAYAKTGVAQGYGGPLQTLALCDSVGNLLSIEVVHDRETKAYLERLRSKQYFTQFLKKKVNDKFLIGDDLNAVSGATISSKAIAIATRYASRDMANDCFHLQTPVIETKWNFSWKEVAMLVIFILAFLSLQFKLKKLRYLVLGLSFVLTGFIINGSVSIIHFGRLILGYIPDIKQHFIYWLLLFGNLLVILFLKKNIYCRAICPFHATQILLNKFSGVNFKLPPKLGRILIKTPKILLWVSLILILVSKNPSLLSYEPFAMFFSLEGVGIQWYILPVSLIGALLSSDFFCRYFCPVGACFNLVLSSRQKIANHIKDKKNE
ncbi:FMN-binding protein [Puteibacter caeruleilacunae]|nr:FMN-binding protein [Puteibacter caeruleilacunae]